MKNLQLQAVPKFSSRFRASCPLFLTQHAPDIMEEYRELIVSRGEFFAARYIVDIVDHYNHINDIGVVNG